MMAGAGEPRLLAKTARHHAVPGQLFEDTGVVTLLNLFVPSPDAVTGALSQMPMSLLKMWLCAILTATGVPPENTRTPVGTMSEGPGGPSSPSPRRLFVPMELRTITLPFRSSNSPGGRVWACIVTPARLLPAM